MVAFTAILSLFCMASKPLEN